MRKSPGSISRKMKPIEEWKELSSSTSWDIADAIRNTAVNTNPGRPVRMTYEQGTYRMLILEDGHGK